jgi:hypothetical protein
MSLSAMSRRRQVVSPSLPTPQNSYNFQTGSSLWQDTSASTAAAIADPIGRVNDLVGSANFLQATSGNRGIRRSGGIELDGSNDNLEYTSAQLVTGSWTVELWVTPLNTSGTKTWFMCGTSASLYGLLIRRESTSFVSYIVDGFTDYGITGGTVSSGSEAQVVVTFNGTIRTLYVNGSSVGTSTQSPSRLGSYQYIGSHGSVGEYSPDTIRKLKIYSSALSGSDVSALYSAG